MSSTHSDDASSRSNATIHTETEPHWRTNSPTQSSHSAFNPDSPSSDPETESLLTSPAVVPSIPLPSSPSILSTGRAGTEPRRTELTEVSDTVTQRFVLSLLSGAFAASVVPVVVLGTKGSFTASLWTAGISGLGTMSAWMIREAILQRMSATGTTHSLHGSHWRIQREVWVNFSVLATAVAIGYSTYNIVFGTNGSRTTAWSVAATSPCGVLLAGGLIEWLGSGDPQFMNIDRTDAGTRPTEHAADQVAEEDPDELQ